MKCLFLALFLIGVVPIVLLAMTYRQVLLLSTGSLTWSDAQKYCRRKFYFSDLVNVQSMGTLGTLTSFMASAKLSLSPVWIGLYNDIDSWRWSFNNVLLTNTSIKFWSPEQPDNYDGVESCGGINSTGYWDDYNCTTLKPFICYKDGSTGADRFVGVSTPEMTWTGAQTYCRTSYTDLASSLTQTDNDLLAQVASGQGTSWFGLFRDTWKWVNNTPALNIPWGPGQPDNNNSLENCGALLNGTFSDEDCNSHHSLICNWNILVKKQQVLSLKVKSDGSVLDPEVQSSILQQVNQKMNKHGIYNVTLTWRVQPNGNIFNKQNQDDL